MIVPEVGEEEWIVWLLRFPFFSAPTRSAVIVVPHPDDEVLGIGGLIASLRKSGVSVRVVAVTDGEHAYKDVSDLGALRQGEQTKALDRLNVAQDQVLRLRLPDSAVASVEPVLVEQLLGVVSQDVVLFAPWRNDYHPDHEACGRAAEQVAEKTGASLISYLFWTWHFRSPSRLNGLDVRRFQLDADLLNAKQEALACHQSQLSGKFGEPILYEPLLAPARRPFETFVLHDSLKNGELQ